MMEYEGLNFPEAVERLAAEAGMEVPVERPEERQKRNNSKTLKEVVALAAQCIASSYIRLLARKRWPISTGVG